MENSFLMFLGIKGRFENEVKGRSNRDYHDNNFSQDKPGCNLALKRENASRPQEIDLSSDCEKKSSIPISSVDKGFGNARCSQLLKR